MRILCIRRTIDPDYGPLYYETIVVVASACLRQSNLWDKLVFASLDNAVIIWRTSLYYDTWFVSCFWKKYNCNCWYNYLTFFRSPKITSSCWWVGALCKRFSYGYLEDRTTVPSQSSGMLLLRSPFKALNEWLVAAWNAARGFQH